MRAISPRHYAIAAIVSLIIIGVGIGAFVIAPAVRSIAAMDANIRETKRYIERQYAKIKHVRRSVERLPEINAFAKEVQNSAIESGMELSLITTLEELAAVHRVEQTLDVRKRDMADQPTPGFLDAIHLPRYTIAFTAIGRFENLLAHLRSIETLPTIIIIPSLQFESYNSPGKPGQQTLLRFTGYVFARETAAL